MTNETITLERNGGIRVQMRLIDWEGGATDAKPVYLDHDYTTAEIIALGIADAVGRRYVTLTEDDLEAWLIRDLEHKYGAKVARLRWVYQEFAEYVA